MTHTVKKHILWNSSNSPQSDLPWQAHNPLECRLWPTPAMTDGRNLERS